MESGRTTSSPQDFFHSHGYRNGVCLPFADLDIEPYLCVTLLTLRDSLQSEQQGKLIPISTGFPDSEFPAVPGDSSAIDGRCFLHVPVVPCRAVTYTQASG